MIGHFHRRTIVNKGTKTWTYVDRGKFPCEVPLYLLSLKVSFPSNVFLIRGNHETANQTAACGFKVPLNLSLIHI